MKIAICTKGRPNRQRTLQSLYPIFPKQDIYLFVEPNELEQYKKYEPLCNIIDLGENDKGVRFARKAVIDYFKVNFPTEILCMADDDIDSFTERTIKAGPYWKMAKMSPAQTKLMFNFHEQYLKEHIDCGQTTISFSGSNFLFDGEDKVNTRCWAFMFFNTPALIKNDINYDLANGFELFEDYDITIQMLLKGLYNKSFYRWAFNTKFANKGGVEMFRFDKAKNEQSVNYMCAKYPEIATKFFSKQHRLPEVKINWKKAVEAGKNKDIA